MRLAAALSVLLLTACADDSMTRTFSMSRNEAPETMASTQLPLSAPPSLALRPTRPNVLASGRAGGGAAEAVPPSAGQEALVQAAGPAAEPGIRAVINENAGLVYPGPAFVDQMLNWTPPPGYTPLISQGGSRGSWLSRMF